jgi:DNA invertase Pin-like site-specific DNA recombinase
VTAVARELSISRMRVYRWLKKLGVDPQDYRA